VRFLNAEGIHEPRYSFDLRRVVVDLIGEATATSKAWKIRGDDAVSPSQRSCEVSPVVFFRENTVQQNNGFADPAFPIMHLMRRNANRRFFGNASARLIE
jgi:hypothetical protein